MANLLEELDSIEAQMADVARWSANADKEKARNIVWLDLEMTSLEDPEILECAVIITDKDLNELVQSELSIILILGRVK